MASCVPAPETPSSSSRLLAALMFANKNQERHEAYAFLLILFS